MSIIKRRKTSNYLQLHNHPVQHDLEIEAVGLLAYIISLPEDWNLHKTWLYKRFPRRKVDRAWNELIEKRYAIGFIAYDNGRRRYFYSVSDIPFTKEEFDTFVKEILEEEGNLKAITNLHGSFEITDVRNVQHKMNSTKRTVQNEQLQRNNQKETKTKKQEKRNIVNKELVNKDQEIKDKLILEYMKKGLSKEVCFRVLEEVEQKEGIKNFGAYFRTCLENALYKSQLKKDPSKKYDELTSHLPEDHPLKFEWWKNEYES